MSSLGINAAKGLPALLGVLGGVLIYENLDLLWLPLAIFMAGVLVLVIGRSILRRYSEIGLLLIELWIVAAISVMALTAAALIWLSFNAQSFLPVKPAEREKVYSTVLGAITTYLALLWTKDIEEARGSFWPSTQFKKALRKAFDSGPEPLAGGTRKWEAVYADRVLGGPTGWGFMARRMRIDILREQ